MPLQCSAARAFAVQCSAARGLVEHVAQIVPQVTKGRAIMRLDDGLRCLERVLQRTICCVTRPAVRTI